MWTRICRGGPFRSLNAESRSPWQKSCRRGKWKNGDCHQFAPRHDPRNKALSLKRIGWLEAVKKSGTATSGLALTSLVSARIEAAAGCAEIFSQLPVPDFSAFLAGGPFAAIAVPGGEKSGTALLASPKPRGRNGRQEAVGATPFQVPAGVRGIVRPPFGNYNWGAPLRRTI